MLRQPQRSPALLIAALLIAGCNVGSPTATVASPPPTPTATETPVPSPTATAPHPESLPQTPKTLTICLVGEPDTLYLYGGSQLTAAREVMEALYDGPIDYRNYTYQPVILHRIPTLADGDVITRAVRVQTGDRVVDAAGQVVELTKGVRIRPLDCHADACAIEFEGEPVWMERMYVTFQLRDDLRWSDGEPLTAEDSVFAFEVASDPATPTRRDLVERTASYRALDAYRVKWGGLPGFLDPTYFLNFFAPLPRHQLEGRDPAALLRAAETRRYPLGWGPFVVETWVPGESLALARNPHYFRASEGLPYLDRLVFRFASDVPDMTARLLAGECDVGVGGEYADYDPLLPLLLQAEQAGLLDVLSAPGSAWEQLDLGIVPVSTYRRPDLLGDARVRQAIALCIDRQAIADEIAHGLSVVPDAYVPPAHPLANSGLIHWAYDPQEGQALLERVGWLDTNEDGVREARNVQGIRAGTLFELTLLTPIENTTARQVARVIETNLADCGIRVHMVWMPAQNLFAPGPDGPLFGRQFDLVETTRRFDLFPACADYTSSQIPDRNRWNGINISGYSNPAYDAACQTARQALTDSPVYRDAHRQALALFSEDLPAIPLFVWPRIILARPSVLNLAADATAPNLWNVEMLDVE